MLLAVAVWGSLLLIDTEKMSAPNKGRTVLSVYTSGQATTPQMAFWKALADGDLTFSTDVHYWKNLDDLRGLLLAGKGDIWIGHVDGFALAAMRGAPVRLVSVTGWKKFYLLSNNPELHNFSDIMTLPEETEIAVAPPQSPGLAVLRGMEKIDLPRFQYAPYDPKQLALKAMKNELELLVLPEPLVTVLLKKAPQYHIVASVEEEYGKMAGKEARLPMAGIAINTRTLEKYPGLAEKISSALLLQEKILIENPELGLEALPDEFEKFIPKAMVQASLKRDIICVRSGADAKDSVIEYLQMLFPNKMVEGSSALPETFFGAKQ